MLASTLIFGLYASQYTPPLYAMGYIGSGRQINIYCYSSYWCIFAILYYWINWFKHTRSEPSGLPAFLAVPSHRAAFFLAGILMLAVGLVGPEDPLPSLQRPYLRQGNHCHCAMALQTGMNRLIRNVWSFF